MNDAVSYPDLKALTAKQAYLKMTQFKSVRWMPDHDADELRLGHLHLVDQLDRLFILDVFPYTFWVEHGPCDKLTFTKSLIEFILELQDVWGDDV